MSRLYFRTHVSMLFHRNLSLAGSGAVSTGTLSTPEFQGVDGRAHEATLASRPRALPEARIRKGGATAASGPREERSARGRSRHARRDLPLARQLRAGRAPL